MLVTPEASLQCPVPNHFIIWKPCNYYELVQLTIFLSWQVFSFHLIFTVIPSNWFLPCFECFSSEINTSVKRALSGRHWKRAENRLWYWGWTHAANCPKKFLPIPCFQTRIFPRKEHFNLVTGFPLSANVRENFWEKQSLHFCWQLCRYTCQLQENKAVTFFIFFSWDRVS